MTKYQLGTFVTVVGIISILLTYLVVIAWLKPEKYKSLLNIFGELIGWWPSASSWYKSNAYFWLMRIILVFTWVVCILFFLFSIITFIHQYILG